MSAACEQGVFQKEDIHAAVQIQEGLRSGANRTLEVGRLEEALLWFHEQVRGCGARVDGP